MKLNSKLPDGTVRSAQKFAVYLDIPNEYAELLTRDSTARNDFTDHMIRQWTVMLPADHQPVPGSRWLIELADDYYSFAADNTKIRLSRLAEPVA